MVLPLWVVENRPSPLLWPLAYTTACTTVQAVIVLAIAKFLVRSVMNADQQKEATADLQLAVDFLQQEYADELGPNFTQLHSVPLMLARLRRAKHHHVDPARAELLSPHPSGTAPAANSVKSTPPLRHWRRRRLRRGGIQQPAVTAVTSLAPAASPDFLLLGNDLEKATPAESAKAEDHEPTTEIASTSTTDPNEDKFEELDADLVDERSQYAKRLLSIAHGLHYGSIAILGVFVVQV